MNDDPTNDDPHEPDRHQPPVPAPPLDKTRSVHVRGIPATVWRHARSNALLSGLPFKAYVTRLLAQSTPFAEGPRDQATLETKCTNTPTLAPANLATK